MENDKPGPPPIPELPEPIQYAHFEAHKNGFFTVGRDRDLIEKARNKAQDWINKNPLKEIISIDSCFGKMLAIVTVWYRDTP